MQNTESSIVFKEDGNLVKKTLFEYDEEEQQQNEINRANSKLVFSPKFIPFYPSLLELDLSLTDCLIYGFIDFYLGSNPAARFYFTDQQIADIFKCSVPTVKATMKTLSDAGLIERHTKIRAGGGNIRFVKINTSQGLKTIPHRTRKLAPNNNKVNENKIKDAVSNDTEAKPLNSSFGDPAINQVLALFEQLMGFKSAGTKDRFCAKHLLRNFPIDVLAQMMEYCAADKFAPRIGSVEQLWYKRGNIQLGMKNFEPEFKVVYEYEDRRAVPSKELLIKEVRALVKLCNERAPAGEGQQYAFGRLGRKYGDEIFTDPEISSLLPDIFNNNL